MHKEHRIRGVGVRSTQVYIMLKMGVVVAGLILICNILYNWSSILGSWL